MTLRDDGPVIAKLRAENEKYRRVLGRVLAVLGEDEMPEERLAICDGMIRDATDKDPMAEWEGAE